LHAAVSKPPASSAKYLASDPAGYPSKVSEYGIARPATGGGLVTPLPCPVVVVRLYTNPGASVTVYLPPDGVTSVVCTKKSAWLLELRLVAQTWTVPVDSPPATVNETVCAAVARVVSTTVL
jgi:hypothetical protein